MIGIIVIDIIVIGVIVIGVIVIGVVVIGVIVRTHMALIGVIVRTQMIDLLVQREEGLFKVSSTECQLRCTHSDHTFPHLIARLSAVISLIHRGAYSIVPLGCGWVFVKELMSQKSDNTI